MQINVNNYQNLFPSDRKKKKERKKESNAKAKQIFQQHF